MVVWRCPHCATPQAEAARCWVCHRSTTSCATCRHFRRSVASGLGICGLDPQRTALTGAEIRVCWTARNAATPEPIGREVVRGTGGTVAATDGGRVPRTFVPVDELVSSPQPSLVPAPGATDLGPAQPPLPPTTPGAVRWSLWDEPER